jgi:DDE superfamily endonuclease
MILPPEARPLLAALAPGFTRPTFSRFAVLLAAAILTQGRHTVANLLRTLGSLAPGHRTDYQRVLSRAPWSGLGLGRALAGYILLHLCPTDPVILVGDDTVDGHPRQARLRQGAAPRPGPVLACLHRLEVRPSLGRPGGARPLPLGDPPLGAARARGPLPERGG